MTYFIKMYSKFKTKKIKIFLYKLLKVKNFKKIIERISDSSNIAWQHGFPTDFEVDQDNKRLNAKKEKRERAEQAQVQRLKDRQFDEDQRRTRR